jgi:hypothetical protein
MGGRVDAEGWQERHDMLEAIRVGLLTHLYRDGRDSGYQGWWPLVPVTPVQDGNRN